VKCSACNRRINTAAVTIGRLSLGPVCAKRAGLMTTKRRTRAVVPAVLQNGQLNLFEQPMEIT